MNNQDIAKHSAAMLDLFEAEQQRILLLDPKERAMQHNYQKTMAVCYELRTFIRSIDAKPSAVLEAAPASSAMAMQAVDACDIDETIKDLLIAGDLLHERWKAQSKAVSRRLIEHVHTVMKMKELLQAYQFAEYGMTPEDWDEFRLWMNEKHCPSLQSQQSPVQAIDAGRQG